MFNRVFTRFSGVPATPRVALRPLVIVLALLQLVAPVSAAIADPAPPPVSHADHLGSPDDPGCEPFHDDTFCLSCRVLFSQPLDSRPTPTPRPLRADADATLRDLAGALPDAPASPPLRARAPPLV